MGTTEIERLGQANLATSVSAAELADGTLYVGSRVLLPAIFAAFDVATGAVTDNYEIEGSGHGSLAIWAIEAVDGGREIYLGLSGDGSLYRHDPAAGEPSLAASFGEGVFVWDLAATPDEETIYAATYPGSRVFAYDVATGDVTDLGPAAEGEEYARSIAVTGEAVYVGVGSHPKLVRLDPETGEREDLLPPECATASFADALAVTDEYVVAGVGKNPTCLAIVNRTDPDDYRVVDLPGEGVSAVAADGRSAYVASDGVSRVDLATGDRAELFDAGARALFVADGTLVGAGRTTWTYDLEGDDVETFDLEAAGLARGAQQAQSLAASDGRVYAGGSGQLTAFDADTGERRRVETGGEPKAMSPKPSTGELYLATYTGAGIEKYDPRGPAETTPLARLGREQHRPRDSHYHPQTGLLFVGSRPMYGKLGGAIAAFDTGADELVEVRRGVVPDQSIAAVTADADALYVGSEIHGGMGTDPVAEEAVLAALDLETRRPAWEAVPVAGAPSVTGLVVLGGTLYGFTGDGTLFAFDASTRETTLTEDVADGSGKLVVADGRVYGATADVLFGHDPATGETRTLLDGLRGDWHSTPELAAGDDGDLYAIRGRDVLRVAP